MIQGGENMEVVCGELNDSIPGLQYYNLLQCTRFSLFSWTNIPCLGLVISYLPDFLLWH